MLPITLSRATAHSPPLTNVVVFGRVRLVGCVTCPECGRVAASREAMSRHLAGPDHGLPRREVRLRSRDRQFVAVPDGLPNVIR